MNQPLDTELKTYERHRNELLGTSEGKHVLIYEDKIIGVFDAKSDAIQQGYDRFGNVPFLVKQVLKIEIPQNFVSSLLAV